MVFSSPIFIFLFLPTTLTLYFFIRRELKNLVLLIASLVFYAWGEPKLILLMIISIICNYFFGIMVDRSNDNKKISKYVVVISVIFNLTLLIFFKYFNFIIENLNILLDGMGIQILNVPNIHLPVGISFFTFQALSYVIDVYRKDAKVQMNIFNLALYISLFPQLIAGPIVRYHDVDIQINNRSETLDKFSYGIKRFIIGFGKKIIIANTVGSVADKIFIIDATNLTFGLSWLGIFCYTLQIYYDFSGYSDMAIGLGGMFGFHFLENFNYPYISKSIKEFWRRWHISLSSWFRDYVYIPLGGNRYGIFRLYRNLLVVFLLTGLWHGSSWNFIIWGLFHGVFLTLERSKFGKILSSTNEVIRHLYTLIIVMIGWVFFRSENLNYALSFIMSMFGAAKGTGLDYNVSMYINSELIVTMFIAVIGTMPIMPKLIYNSGNNIRIKGIIYFLQDSIIFVVFIISILYLSSVTYNPFIYFRF